MKTVDLHNYHYPALLLPCSSGIQFEQQVAGLSCDQRQLEGIILPCPGLLSPHVQIALEALHPGCSSKLDWEEACKLDDLLKQYGIPLEVLKERRQESTEAWVHVRIMSKQDHWPLQLGSSEHYSYMRFARKLKPDVTDEEIAQALEWHTFVNTDLLADFANESAILTWENCD